MSVKSKRMSAPRPPADQENLSPRSAEAMAALSAGFDGTPTKKGTMARLKETFFSPFRALSPTNSPKSKSGASSTVSGLDDINTRKLLFSPGIAPENEIAIKKGAALIKRASARRGPTRKGSSMALHTANATPGHHATASSVPKLDLVNVMEFSAPKATSPRKDTAVSSPRSRVIAMPPLNLSQNIFEQKATEAPEEEPVTPKSGRIVVAPVFDFNGNCIVNAPLPEPIAEDFVRSVVSAPAISSTANNIVAPKSHDIDAADLKVMGTPMRKPPVPAADATPSRVKALQASAKKREAPATLQSPAKRRRLSISAASTNNGKPLVLNSPGKAAQLFRDPAQESNKNGDKVAKIITQTSTYSCDREITDRERRRKIRERSMTITPAPVLEMPPTESIDNVETRPRADSVGSAAMEVEPTPMPSPRNVGISTTLSQGTMREIIEWMIFNNESPNATDSFIMAYSHFGLTSAELFNQICELYQTSTEFEHKRRVVAFLSRWLDSNYSTDFYAVGGAAVGTVSTIQYARFREMMNKDGLDVVSSAPPTALAIAGKRSRRGSSIGGVRGSILRRAPATAPSQSGKTDFLSMNHQELATQLTIMEFNMVRSVQMNELKNQAWNKADRETRAPRVNAIISHFNKISFWVATEIVTCEQQKDQVKKIIKFIKFANMFREAGNMNGVMEIISGLNSLPVQRMRAAWRMLPSKHAQSLKKLEDLVAPTQNFFRYRTELKTATSPLGFMVPYIGVHLGDLVHISEGYLDPENGKIDVTKLMRLGDCLVELRKYQQQVPQSAIPPEDTNYSLWLHNLKPLPQDVLEKLSQEIKEREEAANK